MKRVFAFGLMCSLAFSAAGQVGGNSAGGAGSGSAGSAGAPGVGTAGGQQNRINGQPVPGTMPQQTGRGVQTVPPTAPGNTRIIPPGAGQVPPGTVPPGAVPPGQIPGQVRTFPNQPAGTTPGRPGLVNPQSTYPAQQLNAITNRFGFPSNQFGVTSNQFGFITNTPFLSNQFGFATDDPNNRFGLGIGSNMLAPGSNVLGIGNSVPGQGRTPPETSTNRTIILLPTGR